MKLYIDYNISLMYLLLHDIVLFTLIRFKYKTMDVKNICN
jgi:hypothetical protein